MQGRIHGFLLVVVQLSCFRHSGFVEESLMLMYKSVQLPPERHLHVIITPLHFLLDNIALNRHSNLD